MLNRRDFLKAATALTALGGLPVPGARAGVQVNDVHSKLNSILVDRVVPVQSMGDLQQQLALTASESKSVSIAGARHSMGGQQFGTNTILLDTQKLNRVLSFDPEAGTIEVESGIQWPELINYLLEEQKGRDKQWGIAQKQTGADRLSLGGAVSSNIHSRGLAMKPFISDVESIVLLDGKGEPRVCSRKENEELFRLAFGGYGLFGFVYSIKVRLSPRQKIERVVKIVDRDQVITELHGRRDDGFLYGDWQYSTDEASDNFLNRGVMACYKPVDPSKPIREDRQELSEVDWNMLTFLSHADRARAYEFYAKYYLSTSGQIYWTDTHQLTAYFKDYHLELDMNLGARHPGSEMITEIYTPRDRLADFLAEAASDFRKNEVLNIYGTVRLIEKDDESFLAWAKEPWACTIFNLHIDHSEAGIAKAKDSFRRLIDMAIQQGGSYFLTYHKWATRKQVLACYPQFPEFLRLKKKYDPEERFQSDWYRHYKEMFADLL